MSPPDLRGRETLDSLHHLSEVLGIYKESAQEIVEQWPDLELRSQKYQEALHSAPDAMKATVRDLKKRAEAAKTPAEKDRWETAAQIFEGASGHLASEETRVANVSDVLEKMISELKDQVEFCDIIGQRLTEVPSNLTGSDLDALGKEIETLSGQFEKIMDSMRQLGIELENASTPSAAKRTLPEAA